MQGMGGPRVGAPTQRINLGTMLPFAGPTVINWQRYRDNIEQSVSTSIAILVSFYAIVAAGRSGVFLADVP